MKEKKQDLRVIKTRRNIKAVFLELVKKKPVEKITVTEIASQALINKGTFYLHYSDIYSLYEEVLNEFIENTCSCVDFYDEFFNFPEDFVKKFFKHMQSFSFETVFPFFNPATIKFHFPMVITDSLKRNIYKANEISPSTENDIKLEAAITSTLTTMLRYGNDNIDEAAKISAKIISSLFS